jgi:hypothetical protein
MTKVAFVPASREEMRIDDPAGELQALYLGEV